MCSASCQVIGRVIKETAGEADGWELSGSRDPGQEPKCDSVPGFGLQEQNRSYLGLQSPNLDTQDERW